MSTVAPARPKTVEDITAEAISRYNKTPDPRLKEIMVCLTKHLHAFAKEVNLTEAEWFAGIQFLTRVGHMCSDSRQEFILLSDTLGLSMVVDLLSNAKPTGATESTVFGPFHRDNPPEKGFGDEMFDSTRGGVLTFISGRVTDMNGKPIANAALDVWQAGPDGLYDSQDTALHGGMNFRGLYHTDAEGRYLVKTTRPVAYQVPNDGPVGDMLRAANRHPWRPAHTHFLITAPGYASLTTHIFDSIDPYLNSDVVFGVKDSLIVKFEEHKTEDEAAKKFGAKPPFCTATYDFVLAPANK
jgi:protocatechuate 3,4-dioxygenase beta subunit